jgi:hypothetical protein
MEKVFVFVCVCSIAAFVFALFTQARLTAIRGTTQGSSHLRECGLRGRYH